MLADDPTGYRLAGATLVGCLLPAEGRTANLDLVQGSLGRAVASFDHETDATDTDPSGAGVTFAVYVDRVLTAFSTPADGFDTDPMADGAHSVLIIPVPANSPGFPSYLPGDTQGARIWLSWGRSSATDLDAYLVYWDAGLGGSPTTLLATVDLVTISPRYGATPDSGSGTGRLTIDGTYRGDHCNTTWRVKVTGSGTYQYSLDNGSTYNGTDQEFSAGSITNLPNGLRLRWMDAPAAYVTNDYWAVPVGPVAYYETTEQSAGTYQFAVKARDLAGNIGTASSTLSATLAPEPAPPTNPAGTWNTGTSVVTLTWTASTTAGATYNIYANWTQLVPARLDYVDEASPIATAIAGATSKAITLTGQPGDMMFYVRAVSSGVEERNASLVRVQCSATPRSSLVAPVVVSTSAEAGGYISALYQVNIEDATPASLNVYVHTSATPDWSTATAAETIDPYTPADSPLDILTWTSASTYSGTKWVTIRAVDDSGNETDNTDVTAVTADSTAPGQVTGLEAWPT